MLLAGLLRLGGVGAGSLYPTEAERVQGRRGDQRQSRVVALYGPILDVHSTGELAMTKMTVLYAVFVAT